MHGTYGGPSMKIHKGAKKISGPKAETQKVPGPGPGAKRKSGIPASRAVESTRRK